MGIFSSRHQDDQYGLVIEIGSGSVLLAIIHSNLKQPHPVVVWSHREHGPLRNIESLADCSKAVITALVNASLQFDGKGRKALAKYNSKAKISSLQCTISAPWSYTITKNINYNQDNEFEITEELIDELSKTIEEKINHEINTNELLKEQDLQLIAKHNMGILANGYHIEHPCDNRAKNLSVSQSYAFVQQYFIDAVEEFRDKLMAKVPFTIDSTMLVQYVITRDLIPNQFDFGLINISFEATEIGIVRDGILTYSTHTPFGSYSLAREISNSTKVPLNEAFAWLHTENPYDFIKNLTASQTDDVEKIFDNYAEKVSELFRETGDNLSIPKTMSLRTDQGTETIFSDLITKACKRAIRSEPYITLVRKELNKSYLKMTGEKNSDFGLNIIAQFFHNRRDHIEIQNF